MSEQPLVRVLNLPHRMVGLYRRRCQIGGPILLLRRYVMSGVGGGYDSPLSVAALGFMMIVAVDFQLPDGLNCRS
jgi:hypothetical protein